jgi:glycosyltransferase involved in cell wall biosynthesis
MNLLTVSNLYPRPDQPTRGMFNEQLFREMASVLGEGQDAVSSLSNVCFVPEWRLWRWPQIRRWSSPSRSNHETRYVPVFYIPVIGRNWSAAFYRRGLDHIRDHIDAHELLYASWMYPDGVAVVDFARRTGKPAWIMVLGTDTQHLDNPARARPILRAAADARGLICVCEPLAERLVRAGVSRDQVHVVPNGVDASRFHCRAPVLAQRELIAMARRDGYEHVNRFFTDLQPGARIVLFVGNLVEVKAPDLLLEAFSRLRDADPVMREHLHLVVIGSGAMQPLLESRANVSSACGRVHFMGNLPHEMIPLWMNIADCLGLTSRSEGMPNVILEALASGLPLVCTRVGACESMVAGESATRLAPSGDSGAISRGMKEVLMLDTNRTELAARHGAYTWRHQAQHILELIKT